MKGITGLAYLSTFFGIFIAGADVHKNLIRHIADPCSAQPAQCWCADEYLINRPVFLPPSDFYLRYNMQLFPSALL